MSKTKRNLFSATHSVAKKGTVAMLCMILFGLISIAGCKKDEADCGEKEPEYPIETPFTEYSLPENFQWKSLAYNNSVTIINSEEELTHYVESTDGSYPIIDFSKHTILLANGKADNGVSKISVTDLQQLSENNFELSIEILKKGIDILEPWTVALIIEKVNEESNVKLNLNLSDYPINIPFEKYSLFGTNCNWNLYPHTPPVPFEPYTIIINSKEELEEYIFCGSGGGSYPEIDFTSHTLILAIGVVDKFIFKFNTKNLQKISEDEYQLNLEISMSDSMQPTNWWNFTCIVEKLCEESVVKLDITYENYPLRIPFTEYYEEITTCCFSKCWDIAIPFIHGSVTIINSDEELKKYFYCAGDYPAIDFSQHTLLLASSVVTYAAKIYRMNLLKHDATQYTLNILTSDSALGESWHLYKAIITPKIDNKANVILIVNP